MRVVEARDRAALAQLYAAGWETDATVAAVVSEIIAAVRERGDAALLDYGRRFDAPEFDLSRLRVAIPMLDQARKGIPADVATGLELARTRVRAFHERQAAADIAYEESDGTRYALRTVPLDAVACYVPGGTAILPSSVIMTVVPAKIAGVGRVIVLTPPGRDGTVSPAILFACALCGADELYAVGGAQAIAAAAYGTRTIAPVDKIVGPGNVYVTEAKRQVFGACAIDGLAGPSEVLVVADETARVEYIAGELLAQAEHDPNARVAAVSESRDVLEAVAQFLELMDQPDMERRSVVEQVLEKNAFLIHAASSGEVFEVIDRFAPEHLSLQVANAEKYLGRIRHAGAVFVGNHTPVAAGDYIAGTNHVLPTSGASRFSSGLRLADFQRSFSVVENSEERMRMDARTLSVLAEFEGLPHHAQTARMRAE